MIRKCIKVLPVYFVVFLFFCFHLQVKGQDLTGCLVTDANDLVTYTFLGEAELDNFGIGLDAAGDFNHDGYIDIVVGAPFHDTGGADGGAAYLFLGGPSADTVFDYRLLAEAANDQLGYGVAGVGDLDNDGFDDMAIGARFSDRASLDAGAVWIVFGSTPPFGTRQIVVNGSASAAAGFGHSVAGGDFNGDGFYDLAVGAPFDSASPQKIQSGKVQIFFGSADPNAAFATPDPDTVITLIGESANNQFGWSIDSAGDVNNDGYDDLIVGARWFGSFPDSSRGQAYIYFGGDPMDDTADLILTGENKDDWLGYSVAGAGNVNGDLFDDVIISAPFYPAASASGRCYILYGGNSMDNIPDIILDGSTLGNQFGWSVDGGIDINNDTFDDVIVGARFNDCAAPDSGATSIYYGGTTMDNQPDILLGSTHADDALGTNVAMIGNWAANGQNLAAVSAIWHDAGIVVNNPTTEGAFGAVFTFGLPTSLSADFNNDNCVNRDDFLHFLQYWLDTNCTDPDYCSGSDLNQSGKVNMADFGIMAVEWLICSEGVK